jgi:Arc/MetJ family transcription regulator
MGAVVGPAPGRGARPGILGDVTTLAINDDLYAEVQRRAAAEGTTDAAVVEAALRSYLGADGLIDRIHERNRDVSDDVAALAYEELGAYRAERDAN